MEEYEQWKATIAAYSNDMLAILPEFNMEKNIPVEDDEKIMRKDEWWCYLSNI